MPLPAHSTPARGLLAWTRRLPLGIQLHALVLMAVMVPLAIYLAVALPLTLKTLVDSNTRRLEIQSAQGAGELERFFSRREAAIRALSQADVLEHEDKAAISQYFNEIKQADGVLEEIFLTDVSGQVVAGTGVVTSEDVTSSLKKPEEAKLIESCTTASQGEVYFSEPIMLDSGLCIYQATPVTDDANEVVIKVLLCRVSLSRPRHIVTEFSERFEGETMVCILNSGNQVICSSDSGIGFLEPFGNLVEQHRDGDPVFLDKSGEIKYRNSGGFDVAAGFSKMSSFGSDQSLAWTMVAVTPVVAVAGPVWETAIRLLVIGIAVALFSMAFATHLTRRITRPLKELASAARDYKFGANDKPLPTGNAQEIGDISSAFNAMARSIQHRKQALIESEENLRLLNSELESRVVARTKELGIANDDLEAYAHSVAHDLRAPLRAMYGFSRALREDYGERLDDTGREYTGFIEEATHQMDQLICDLLEYSKIGRCDVSIEVLDLNEVVNKAVFQLSTEISQSGAVISIQPSMGTVAGHRSTLIQIVFNLVSNALKFVNRGASPQIRIWSETGKGSLKFWVEDKGIGISQDFHDKVFKVFERLHGIETYPGTGIGLAIVRRSMESMGGRFGVESAPGQGSRFWVEIPNRD